MAGQGADKAERPIYATTKEKRATGGKWRVWGFAAFMVRLRS
jgi:hypothetical protein